MFNSSLFLGERVAVESPVSCPPHVAQPLFPNQIPDKVSPEAMCYAAPGLLNSEIRPS